MIKIFVPLLLVTTMAFAEGPVFKSCVAQVKENCSTEKTSENIILCLKKNEADLSQDCKDEIKRIVRAADQVNEQGNRSLSILGGLSSQAPPFPIVSYEGILVNGNTAITDQRLNISAPVYQTSADYLAISLAGSQVHINESLVLSSGFIVPEDFYRAEIGFQYKHQLADHRNWGLRGAVGYATDHFSGNTKDTIFNLTFQYGYPSGTGGFWTWVLFISNNSPIGNYIPIPGVMYFYKAENFTALLGFPIFSLQWTPDKNWAYSLSALGPLVTAEVANGKVQSVQTFTSLSWNVQSFVLEKRLENKDRLSIEDKKASIGVRSFVFDRMQLEAKAGYSFDRQVYSGNGFRNMKLGHIDLDSNWFLAVSLKSAL